MKKRDENVRTEEDNRRIELTERPRPCGRPPGDREMRDGLRIPASDIRKHSAPNFNAVYQYRP